MTIASVGLAAVHDEIFFAEGHKWEDFEQPVFEFKKAPNRSQLPELSSFVKNRNFSLATPSLPPIKHCEYKLEPLPGDFDFLKEMMPVVDQFTIVNNKFGVGLGIRIF